MDWLPSVLGVGSAKRGSLLLAVWVFAYVSRTLFAWHGPLPLELGISSLASVVLAVFLSPGLYLKLTVKVQNKTIIFSSPEPKAQGELIVWDSSQRPCVRPCVRASTVSNMNISETSWPIIIKFHQEHHWGGGLTALGFG